MFYGVAKGFLREIWSMISYEQVQISGSALKYIMLLYTAAWPDQETIINRLKVL